MGDTQYAILFQKTKKALLSMMYFPFTPPPPLRKHGRGPSSQAKTAVQRPPPCLDKAVHARDTCDSQTGNNIVSHG